MEFLIPETFFEDLHSALLLALLVVAILILVKGADFFVEGAVALANRLHVPNVIIGATIISLGTTAPEAAVSVIAAFQGMPDFALGNSVGSIICDTGLIFGLSCLLARLPLDRFVLNRHGWVQFGAGVLLVISTLLFRNTSGEFILPRGAGIFFVSLLFIYMLISIFWARQHSMSERKHPEAVSGRHRSLMLELLMIPLGLLLILLGSRIMIQSIKVLCLRWGVPPAILAATLVAFGTSLPELVTALACIYKKQTGLLVGNIIGADILNVFFVTGAAACAMPLSVDPSFYKLHLPVMMSVLIIFRMSVFVSDKTFKRWPGLLLLLVFLLYLGGNVWLSTNL